MDDRRPGTEDSRGHYRRLPETVSPADGHYPENTHRQVGKGDLELEWTARFPFYRQCDLIGQEEVAYKGPDPASCDAETEEKGEKCFSSL